MPASRGSVPGRHDKHQSVLYALSTCVWCRRTRQFLEREGVAYDYVYVDLIQGREKEAVMTELRRWAPKPLFPTLVVDDSRCVVGMKLEQMKEILEL